MDSLCITGLPRDQSINCNSTVASFELYLSAGLYLIILQLGGAVCSVMRT
jgi:hypothetical protein